MKNIEISQNSSSGHGGAVPEAGAKAPGEPGPATTSATIGVADGLGNYNPEQFCCEEDTLRQQRFRRREQSSKWLIAAAREEAGLPSYAEGVKSTDPGWIRPPRIARCHWRASDFGVKVNLAETSYGKLAYFSNITRCQSIWSCCSCSAQIRSRRANELKIAFANILEDKSLNTGMFLTLTLRHKLSIPLSESLSVLQSAWGYLQTTTRWRNLKKKIGVVGIIRSTEVNYSFTSGFHPHNHYWLILDRRLSTETISVIESEIAEMWINAVKKKSNNKNLIPNMKRACDIQRVTSRGFAAYISKQQDNKDSKSERALAEEMMRFDLKQGRQVGSVTPFQLLDLTDGKRFWLEYVEATRGKRAASYSKGLKTRLGISEPKEATSKPKTKHFTMEPQLYDSFKHQDLVRLLEDAEYDIEEAFTAYGMKYGAITAD